MEYEARRAEAEPPEGGRYILGWFWQLHGQRQAGMAGPLPLSHQELAAWAGLAGLRPEPWEVDALRLLDQTYLDFVAERHESENKGKRK